jgi:tripartite-type tricarboxylate transporter receptor subunit TctC
MKRIVFLLVAMAIICAPLSVMAEYPEKPLSYVIPFNPGGESDITARLQETHLEKFLGQAVNVSHKPGGGGAVGWSDFQRSAKPSGYEVIGVNIPHIVGQPIIRKDAGYKTDNWEVVMWFHFTPNALIVNKDSDFKNLGDLVAYAKKNPKAVTVGGSGTYSANHLEVLRLEKAAGIQLTYVPHTGTGPLVPAVLGNHINAVMSYSMLGTQYKEKLRVLAVASEERVATIPDAPTFKELGHDIVGGAFRGVAAPKGTPKTVVNKLAEAYTYANQKIAPKQEALGFVMTYAKGDEAVALVKKVQAGYNDILEEIAKKKK